MTNISIIITAYNAEKSIGRCLKSIVVQENADMQMECIVIDDCSTDDTLNQMRNFVHAYSGAIRFRMLRHKVHKGVSASRNTGIQQAQGDYLMFVDAVDQLMPGAMDLYTGTLMRYWDTEVIIGNMFHSTQGRGLITNITSPMVFRGESNLICHEMILHHLYLFSLNKLVRRDLIIGYQVFFNEALSFPDLLWNYELFSHVTSMVLLPDITYSYESRPVGAIGVAERQANALLSSYSVTCDKILDQTPRPESTENDFYVDHQLFVYGILMSAVDVQSEYNINSQVKRELGRAKSRLVSQTRNDNKRRLSTFFMTGNSPFGGIQKLPIYKHCLQRTSEIVEMLRLVR